MDFLKIQLYAAYKRNSSNIRIQKGWKYKDGK